MITRQNHQFMTSISPHNRPVQQSSPSENSMSTATPPQVSRASPASTALVMSQNNINGQSNSRQLTPNNSSPSNQGHSDSSTPPNSNPNNNCPPNPMARQFACHSKSMSAGVVVPVPGISNNLAAPGGVHQNNMINNNIFNNQQQQQSYNSHHHHHHRTNSNHQHDANTTHQMPHPQQQMNLHHRSGHQPHHRTNGHHHQNNHPLPSYNSATNNHHPSSQNGGSSNFITQRQPAGSTVVLNSNNIKNIHARSASTHLSNVYLNQNGHAIGRNYPSHITNSNWSSIDENISKSHGKLTVSSYFTPQYMINPSMTDVSCDNVSNVSRFIDGVPAPSYYLHAQSTIPTANNPDNASIKSTKFLPFVDLVFNFISMLIYFCENVFGIIALIALYYHTSYKCWAILGASLVVLSNIICQYLSMKEIYKTKKEECRSKLEAQEELEDEDNCDRRFYNRNLGGYQCGSCGWLPNSATEVQFKFQLYTLFCGLLHLFCLGILIRYLRLVLPISDTARVKREAQYLCMLRVVHSFVQSAPLLLLQSYLILTQTNSQSINNLCMLAAVLSLISVCWSLASFTKYARKKHMHKYVLSWRGILCQFFWRAGTVSSRVAALAIYAVYYNYWMLVLLALHWVSMFGWLIKSGNLLRDEVNLPRTKKIAYAIAGSWIYCFCYVNFEEHNSKSWTMVCYYLLMSLENGVFLMMSLMVSPQLTWHKILPSLVVFVGFVFGLVFMVIYYRYCHINIIQNGLSRSQESVDSIADQLSPAGKKIAGFKPGTLRVKKEDSLSTSHRFTANNITGHPSSIHCKSERHFMPM